jgi:hypothetical protein
MNAFLRKVRGALGIAVTWGTVWAAIFAALGLTIGLIDPDSIDPGEGPVRVAWIGAIYGVVSGAVFAVLLALAEGRKSIRDLSLGRAALWGMLGTAAFPLLTPVDNSMLLIVCPVGAALAAASIAVAKRAELTAFPEQPKLQS